MKKLTAVLLSLLLLLSLGSALATEYNEPGTFPICKEKVTLTVAIADHAKIEDYETNWMTQYIEEKANVDLVFEIYPSAEYNTKINVMIQSGDKLPDIIIGSFSNAMVYSWAQEEALAPLTEYYNDPSVGYYMNDAVERTGANIFSQMTMPDGEIYAIPKLNQSSANEPIAKFQIYKPWLDALNLEAPTTTEEFHNVMHAFVTGDPNGNGIADEMGFVGYGGSNAKWFQALMSSFVYASRKVNFLVANDGVLSYAYTSDAWKEGLKFMRAMFEDGSIAVESLTQDDSQYKSARNTDVVTVGCIADTIPGSTYYTAGDDRYYNYLAIPPLFGPEGVQYAVYEPSACTPAFIVSADCEDPETAFRVGDLMVSEYLSIVTRFGKEGENWAWYKDYDRYPISDPAKFVAVKGAEPTIILFDPDFWGFTQQNNAWMQNGPFIRQYAIADGRMSELAIKSDTGVTENKVILTDGANRMYQESGWLPEEPFLPLLYTDEESAVINDIQATLTSFLEETTAAFLMGSKDIDAEWDSFQQELKTIGIDKALEINQTAYDRAYK